MILDNPVFLEAIDEHTYQWTEVLMASEVGGLTAGQAHAMLVGARSLITVLQGYVDAAKLAEKHK